MSPGGPHWIRVLCVDDDADITLITRLLVNDEPDMECVGTLASADHLDRKVHDLLRDSAAPLIILLDISMPGQPPFEVMSHLRATEPRARTIVYSGLRGPAVVDGAMNAGAWGYISKTEPPHVVLTAIRSVAAGYARPSQFA